MKFILLMRDKPLQSETTKRHTKYNQHFQSYLREVCIKFETHERISCTVAWRGKHNKAKQIKSSTHTLQFGKQTYFCDKYFCLDHYQTRRKSFSNYNTWLQLYLNVDLERYFGYIKTIYHNIVLVEVAAAKILNQILCICLTKIEACSGSTL